MGLREVLKEQTQVSHRQIEDNPLLKMIFSTDLKKQTYIEILSGFYGFIRSLEEVIRRLNPEFEGYLQKADWLMSDLKSLGHSLQVEESNYSQSVKTSAQALGALYVLEGSMLGGQMIIRHLKKFDFITPQSSHYYTGYGDSTGENWKSFLALLNEHEQNYPHQNEVVVTSAIETFKALDNWFLKLYQRDSNIT